MKDSKKKKNVFVIEDDDINYVASVTDKKISMKFSNSDIWSQHVKGEHIGNLVDDGNGIKIKTEEVEFELSYDDFVELFLLMKIKMKFDKQLTGDFKILTKKKK